MKKSGFIKGIILGIIISGIAVFGYNKCISAFSNQTTIKSSDSQILNTTSESKIETIEKLIDKYYLEDADYSNLTESTYEGLVAGLGDPYSVYYTAEEYSELLETSSGTYYGIGMTVQQDVNTGIITVVDTFDGSPCEEAGLEAGDIIYKVEDEKISDEDLSTVVSKIKGEEGTYVKVTVLRDEEYIDFNIERRQIDITTVKGEMLDDGVGYIVISEFEENTYSQFVEVYEDLEKQGMESVVFDLRNNPGGIYDIVVKMLDYILPEGKLVYTEDKYGEVETEYSDAACIDIPMAVIINENSASASEIFAGAIQDYGAGKIIGTTSFGKGIVQRIYPLSDGSAVKLTVSKYYTPNGKNIHGTGIEPDVEVTENQLEAAIQTLE